MELSQDEVIKFESRELNLNLIVEISSDGILHSVKFNNQTDCDGARVTTTKGISDCPVCHTSLSVNIQIYNTREQEHLPAEETIFLKTLEPIVTIFKDENVDTSAAMETEKSPLSPNMEGFNEGAVDDDGDDSSSTTSSSTDDDDDIEEAQETLITPKSGKVLDPSTNPHPCNMCLRSFRRKDELRDHKANHTLSCEACQVPTMYLNKSSLAKHMKRFHLDLHRWKNYKTCDRCGRAIHEKQFQSHWDSCLMKDPPTQPSSTSANKPETRVETLGGEFNLIICAACLQVFDYVSDRKQHYKDHTTTCNFCFPPRNSTSISSLKNHCRKVHQDIMPTSSEVGTCTRCKLKFTQLGLEYHMKRCNDATKPTEKSTDDNQDKPKQGKTYHCMMCFKIFFKFGELRLHYKNHSLICNFCDPPKELSTQPAMLSHISRMHQDIRPITDSMITCPTCSRIINERVFHKHKVHCEELVQGKAKCPICDKVFSAWRRVKQHIKCVHEKLRDHICHICGMGFSERKKLSEHVEYHENPVNVICDICHKEFKSRTAIETHMKALHIVSNKPRHPCDQCTKTFKKLADMKKHQRNHHGKPAFSCQYCGKGFGDRSLLGKHEMIHRDERPFSCPNCEQRFRQKASLVSHLRLHTGEKPYQCEVCQQRFSDRGCYRSHLVKHEKDLGITLDKSVRRFYVAPVKIE